ncbi:unnamed protein product [Bursaphelenchus xylophilus]|uniref:(pine wood nematode) hypothetical protein n=1 Tax=Bursaphelenchus xylophilus TaxID=6326 RepID=A0A1I7RRG4_BURXY|nr:unnamed protein product [Bursaphelenchus xylophilus]CAG9131020.1 unnamed protein product [Bursaphelenchus xylophilus]
MPEKQRLLSFAPALARCTVEASSYGTCVALKAEKVQTKQCQEEFDRLITCFQPYRVLLDGTVCQASLQNKINLREQFPKYLDGAVELFTTKCVLDELERLGKEVYGALKICQQFEVLKCPHQPAKTATKCIEYLARRSQQPGKQRVMVASQDEELLFKMRDMGGVPLLSIKFNTILLEKPSKASLNGFEEKPVELERVEDLKKKILGDGEGEAKKKKKKKKKGKNPLSCLKKKNKHLEQKPKKLESEGEKKKARRKKKKEGAQKMPQGVKDGQS